MVVVNKRESTVESGCFAFVRRSLAIAPQCRNPESKGAELLEPERRRGAKASKQEQNRELAVIALVVSYYSFSQPFVEIIMSVSEWDNEYARLARAASQMRTTGIVTGSNDARSLQQSLSRLEASLDSLPLQPAEIQRRKRLIQHLQQTAVSGGDGSGAGGVGEQSQMAMAMQQQDSMIDELAVGVGRLKNQSAAINDEARLHVNLLNDMDTNLDAARSGLEDETRRAARLKEDQSIWRLQLIVAGLFILLVLLIVMGLSP